MSPAQRAVADRSFEHLYRRHRRDVYGFALRAVRDPHEAEDVTQTAFLNAYRALHRGDHPEKPRAWLLTIANNIARRHFRERALRPKEVELDPELPSNGAEWDALVAREIHGALRRLRPNRREAVILRDIEGLSYAEIAKRMKLSQPAVETLLFRARRELQAELEELGREPSVRRRNLRSLLAFPMPVGLLNFFDSLSVTLSRTPLAARAAGAVAAVVLGAGVATQAGPLVQDASADRRPFAASTAESSALIPEERLHTGIASAPSAQPSEKKPKQDSGSGGSSPTAAAAAAGSSQDGGGATSASSAPVSTGESSASGEAPVALPEVEVVPPLQLPDLGATLEQLPQPPIPTPVPLG